MIEVREVVKRFDGFTALDGATLSVPTGSVYGLIGPNGAGKSTLVRCINLLERPTSGSITVNGQKLTWMEQQADGTLVTLDGDPQMIWENPDGRVVRTLRVEAGYSDEPREVCLYYTNRAGEDFSQDKRVFPQKQADGSYRYTLPYGAIASLRLDPCSPDVNKSMVITLGVVTMNEPAGAGSCFVPSWYQCFCLILYPGLAAAALSLARQAWKKRR